MGKKAEGNKVWKSKSLILIKSKHAILNENKHINKRVKPVLSQDETDDIASAIQESLRMQLQVMITLFGEYNNRILKGQVIKFNAHSKLLKLSYDLLLDDFEWILLGDILKAEFMELD